jgi:hypothetical protein
MTYQAANQPVPPAVDPGAVFARLFAELGADPMRLAAERARSRSILDTVARQYAGWAARLPADDRAKLDAHLTKLRELEQSLAAGEAEAATCRKPALESVAEYRKDANIPRTGKQMMDMLVMALACDLARVTTMQWSDSEAKHTFPWLGLPENHHAYQHDRGFQPEALGKIYNWYAGNLAYLLQALAAVKESERSLLDNTLVLCVTEIQHPSTHTHVDMPFVLAGKAGGQLRTGRWLKVKRQPHNNLLLWVMNLFGVDAQSFGHKDFCTGPLAGL